MERVLIFPEWQVPYFALLSEGPSEPLPERVVEAERAILVRLEQLVRIPGRDMEKHAIRVALHNLCGIKKDRLDFRTALLLSALGLETDQHRTRPD